VTYQRWWSPGSLHKTHKELAESIVIRSDETIGGVPLEVARRIPRLEAYRWWCEDEVCDCTQYKIDRITFPKGRKWAMLDNVWEGRFVTETSAETEDERNERLLEFGLAALEHGIRINRENWTFTWRGKLDL
jgi:hypothetical protein